MWSDRETLDDCLGFSSYVESLADVCLERDIAPLTVGIFGSWGSGKTSLMHMLRRRIDERSSKEEKVVTVWFNAWRYEGKEEIQSALIHSILDRLKADLTITDDITNTLKRLKDGASVLKLAKVITKSAITLTPDFGGFLDAFRDETEKVVQTMESFEKDFETLLEQVHVSRIVVFIDDLDRCSSDKVVEAFETIKLFLNTPETTFVIGADSDKIEQSIGAVYRIADTDRKKFSRDYLEKIVQLPFSIPEQRARDVAGYVGLLSLHAHVTGDGWTTLIAKRRDLLQQEGDVCAVLTEWVEQNAPLVKPDAVQPARETLARSMAHIDVLVRGLRGNPRQVKRFLNILDLRQRIATTNQLDVQADILTKLAALEYTWRDFFNDIVETVGPDGRSELIAEVLRYADGDERPPDTSAMLTAALDTPGLAAFLATAPAIDGATNLSPYLFLAQTALDPHRPTLVPQDQAARDLADRMASDDALRSRAAGRQAAKLDAATMIAIVRLVLGKVSAMQGATEKRARVNALQSLEPILKAVPEHYRTMTETLRSAVVDDQGFAVAAVRLLQLAKSAGVADATDVEKRYASLSPIAAAFGTKKTTAGPKGRPS